MASLPLMLSADTVMQQTVEALLSGNANINAKDHKGSTALIKAASQGHVAVAEILLAKGADPSVENAFKWNALRLAAAKGHLEMVQRVAPSRCSYKSGERSRHDSLNVCSSNWTSQDRSMSLGCQSRRERKNKQTEKQRFALPARSALPRL